MERADVLEVIGEYLAVLRSGRDASEGALCRSLDRLVVAVQPVSACSHDASHPEPPGRTYEAWRKVIGASFPGLGYYYCVQPMEPLAENVGKAEPTLGDAIDDLADIAGDLEEVQFRWRSCSEDALFHFAFLYWAHWGAHLRNLKLYLHDRLRSGQL